MAQQDTREQQACRIAMGLGFNKNQAKIIGSLYRRALVVNSVKRISLSRVNSPKILSVESAGNGRKRIVMEIDDGAASEIIDVLDSPFSSKTALQIYRDSFKVVPVGKIKGVKIGRVGRSLK